MENSFLLNKKLVKYPKNHTNRTRCATCIFTSGGIYYWKKSSYGVIKYGNENLHQIDWDDHNKHLLFSATKEVQRLMVKGGAERNHNRKGKCESCSRRYACDSSLV